MNNRKSGKVRIGIIGAGEMAARLHIPWIKQSKKACVAALCRRDAAAAYALAKQHDIKMVYTNYIDLLKDKVRSNGNSE